MILVGPAVTGLRLLPPHQRFLLSLGARLAPERPLALPQVDRMAITNNPERLAARALDPKVIQTPTTRAIYGAAMQSNLAAAGAERLRAPTLVLRGGLDDIAPDRPVAEADARIAGPTRRVVCVDGGHALHWDLERELVFADVEAWMSNRYAALPSTSHVPPAAEEKRFQ